MLSEGIHGNFRTFSLGAVSTPPLCGPRQSYVPGLEISQTINQDIEVYGLRQNGEFKARNT